MSLEDYKPQLRQLIEQKQQVEKENVSLKQKIYYLNKELIRKDEKVRALEAELKDLTLTRSAPPLSREETIFNESYDDHASNYVIKPDTTNTGLCRLLGDRVYDHTLNPQRTSTCFPPEAIPYTGLLFMNRNNPYRLTTTEKSVDLMDKIIKSINNKNNMKIVVITDNKQLFCQSKSYNSSIFFIDPIDSRIETLRSLFDVRYEPRLVIVDNRGKLITSSGLEDVYKVSDVVGLWKKLPQKTSFEKISKLKLVDKSNNQLSASSLEDHIICIYYSRYHHQQHKQEHEHLMNKCKQYGNYIILIVISADATEERRQKFYKSISVDFYRPDKSSCQHLISTYDLRYSPHLVVVRQSGTIISTTGLSDLVMNSDVVTFWNKHAGPHHSVFA